MYDFSFSQLIKRKFTVDGNGPKHTNSRVL